LGLLGLVFTTESTEGTESGTLEGSWGVGET